VDSSVAAALLRRDGHEVIGVNMRVKGDRHDTAGDKDIEDARHVADKLDIPFHVVDFRDTFEAEVIKPFAEAYAQGITPNPCIVCNRKIKFGLFAQKARELGATHIATGHHARVVLHEGRNMIAAGHDPDRDQSYFLFTLTHDDLEFVRFPVGELTKPEVRRIAEQMALGVAQKAESREVCFVPDDKYVNLVEQYADETVAPGEIVLSDGRAVGRHDGVHRFTVGQRRGLNVALGRPMYVLSIDAPGRKVTIGGKEECRSKGLVARELVWNYYRFSEENMEVEVRIRYRTRPVKAIISPLEGNRAKVVFTDLTPLVTPGQAAVFYRGETVLGGGWIEKPIK